ncbi:transposase [Arenimonas sp.]|uniref:transposase n=1 Tax=Arenimonas sp. TaxID=1872635 RepID=UPI0039E5AC3A
MTIARASLIPPGGPGTYHCVQRCVRRAFLCGIDRHTGQSFEHRKAWIERRFLLLAECFAIAIHAYAVMSNHLHLVVQIDPAVVDGWSDEAVAARWVRLFPPREDSEQARGLKQRLLMTQPERLQRIRSRLSDLSWLMKCLAEPIARAANGEDGCKGRFWEGRFKAQVLCDERALLAAMAYVDLNPIRSGLAIRLDRSRHTSVKARIDAADEAQLARRLQPIAGSIATCLPLSLGDYLALVEWTGRQVRPDKRGAIPKHAPSILQRFESHPDRWAVRVKAIGSGYWRIVGDVQDLTDWAARLHQRWIKGIGIATALAKTN